MSLPSAPTLEDYEAIAEAVMETERGRWFLTQFARRNRAADTAQILDALTRLEERMRPSNPVSRTDDAAGVAEAVAAIRAALTAPTTPERRVALALDRLAVLELLVAGAPREPNAIPPLMLPAPADQAPPPDRPPTVKPKSAAESAIPSSWTRASFEAAAGKNVDGPRRPPEPASAHGTPQPEPPPRRQPPLLESLSDAEKALLFA